MCIVDKVGFTAHRSPIFKKNSVINSMDLIKFNSCIVVYKASNNLHPVIIRY